MDTENYNLLAIMAATFTLILGALAIYIPRRAHKNKYKFKISHEFSKGSYSSLDQAYLTELTLHNAGEVPVSVRAEYKGQLKLDGGSTAYIGTREHKVVINSGQSAMINIHVITGGQRGTAEPLLHCLVENNDGKPWIYRARLDSFRF